MAQRRKQGADPRKKDPTIRQEFPGADTSQKKIEAGIRNVKNKQPEPGPSKPDVPTRAEEPVEENSNDIKPD